MDSGHSSATWTVEEDCVLVGVSTSSANTLISDNPTLSLTDITAPANSSVRNDLILWLSSGSATGSQLPLLNIPLAKGKRIFVISGVTSVVTLYVEPVVSAE